MHKITIPGIVAMLIFAVAGPGASAAESSPQQGQARGNFSVLERGESGENQGLHEIEATVEAAGSSEAVYLVEVSRATFDSINASQLSLGRKLVDIEVRWNGSSDRYTGVWYPVTGTIHTLLQGTTTQWSTFNSEMGAKAGRWLDVEVGYFNAVKRYSAIFYEDGDDYSFALHTTNDDATFQTRLKTYADDGRQIIDFESYEDSSGATKYAGVWTDDPNQPKTHLFYGLVWSDISSMLSPMQGRVIDIDRYVDELNRIRYAVILQIQSGGGWGVYRHQSLSTLNSNDSAISDADTHLIDLESYNNGGTVQHIAVWGNSFKSLNTHPAMLGASTVEPNGAALSALLTNFESGGGPRVGLYAKNVRTNQALAYRSSEMFYLASATKTAVLIKAWQEIQAGRLNANQLVAYTNGTATGFPWYMDERSPPGFDNGVCDAVNDFGQSYPVTSFMQAMMQRSDNGATSAMVDSSVIGVSRDATDLNEWLAGLSGVGQGWGLVTSIQHSDQFIGRHSQIGSASSDLSLFTAPGHTIRPFLYGSYKRCNTTGARCSTTTSCPLACAVGQSCNIVRDPWGDMQAYATSNGASMPAVAWTDAGYARYYNMGVNSATPRAHANLLEKFVEGSLLNSTNTMNAWNQMDEGTNLDNDPSFPPTTGQFGGSGVWVQSKGGAQNGASAPCTDSATFSLGPDTIVVSLLTKGNTLPCSSSNAATVTVRSSLTSPVGYRVLQALAADLEDCGPASGDISPTTLRPGDAFDLFTDVCNIGGGDGFAFNVDFYASLNTNITTSDPFLGRVRVGGIDAGSGAPARIVSLLPTMTAGTYFVGWRIDATSGAGDNHGEVGEFDETNNVDLLPFTITVQPPLTPVEQLRFSSDSGLQWDAVTSAANYTVFEGDGTQLANLATGLSDSCDRVSVTSTIATVPRVPAAGNLLWYLVAAEGDGPLAPATLGARLLDSTGLCGTSCLHDPCSGSGGALEAACDPCVATVCSIDSYCCATAWDNQCANEVLTFCDLATCPSSSGSCTHSICETGGVLVPDCDAPPIAPSCVAAICAADSYCCDTSWDSVCVGEVSSICALNCQ